MSEKRGGCVELGLPERHQAHAQWSPERLVAWGERIGLAWTASTSMAGPATIILAGLGG